MPHPRREIERRAAERERERAIQIHTDAFPQCPVGENKVEHPRKALCAPKPPPSFLLLPFHGFIYFAFYLRLAAPSCPLFLFPVHAYTSPPTCQRAFCCSFQAVGGCKRGWLHGEERPRGHVELESLGPSHDPTTDGSIQRIRGLLENRDFVSCVGRFV